MCIHETMSSSKLRVLQQIETSKKTSDTWHVAGYEWGLQGVQRML